VAAAVRQCWASLFSPRAAAYRLRAGTRHRDMPMAIGVIELIQARADGYQPIYIASHLFRGLESLDVTW
jgi:phosphoenolpyruvate synthase/pyruvate phosphate dikinase